jgi:hypothetical protein
MTHSAHAVLSTIVQNNMYPQNAQFYECTSNNGANIATQYVIRPVNTCLAVPLHKPSRNEPNQNHYYGVQTPSKLAQTICLEIDYELFLLQTYLFIEVSI